MSLIFHFLWQVHLLGSKENKFIKLCPVAVVVHEICGLFMSKIPFKNSEKLLFLKFFAHKFFLILMKFMMVFLHSL